MANKSINALDNTSTLDNADLLVLWKSSANAAYNISGQDFTAMLTALASGHGGIASVNYTAPVPPSLDGTLTITLADGNVNSFTIKNGAKGDTGDQTYVWFAFSSVEPTSDADISVIPGPWMGFYSGLESTQGNLHYTDYTWYEIKGPKGDGVAYTAKTGEVGLTSTYTMYTADGTAVGTFSVTNGEGGVSTVNGIAPDGDGDVPAIVTDVTVLGLTSGSATIADAYDALQVSQMLFAPAAEFAVGELPLVGGSRVTTGTVEIIKATSNGTRGRINFYGKDGASGDWRMFCDLSTSAPTGTWISTGGAVSNAPYTPTSFSDNFSTFVSDGHTAVFSIASGLPGVSQGGAVDVGTISAGYRPYATVVMPVSGANGVAASIEIYTSGTIRLYAPSNQALPAQFYRGSCSFLIGN